MPLREPTSNRINSLDLVRGLVMVLMAIDHVRVYSGLPAGGPTAGIFFTRWVTHFCAPAFCFFAGTSAFLQGRRLGAPALARHLVARGLFLVLLEPTLIRFHLDVQRRRRELLAGRRDLDARLVHGAPRGTRALADADDRDDRPRIVLGQQLVPLLAAPSTRNDP
jgi:hypothetical protein